MSAFNEHQQSYMRYLASLPDEAKCGCGWYPRGDCPNCKPDAGGYERCGSAYAPWPSILCTRKADHCGDHGGIRRVGCGAESMTWPQEPEQ